MLLFSPGLGYIDFLFLSSSSPSVFDSNEKFFFLKTYKFRKFFYNFTFREIKRSIANFRVADLSFFFFNKDSVFFPHLTPNTTGRVRFPFVAHKNHSARFWRSIFQLRSQQGINCLWFDRRWGIINVILLCISGSQILLEKLRKYKPKIAVFNGKLIYEVFSGKKEFGFGRQPTLVDGTNTVRDEKEKFKTQNCQEN